MHHLPATCFKIHSKQWENKTCIFIFLPLSHLLSITQKDFLLNFSSWCSKPWRYVPSLLPSPSHMKKHAWLPQPHIYVIVLRTESLYPLALWILPFSYLYFKAPWKSSLLHRTPLDQFLAMRLDTSHAFLLSYHLVIFCEVPCSLSSMDG